MANESVNQNPLGVEKISRLLRQYAIPSVISMVINALYNIVDQIFIGNYIGYLGNGATNIIAPIVMVAIALSGLMGDGLAAVFSLNLGRKQKEQAAHAVGTITVVASAIGLILGLTAFALIKPLCNVFGATENILPYALRYGRIIVLGFPFVIVSTSVNASIRADGSPRYAMFSMMAGAVLNTILDPLFIIVFHWDIEGAAIATVFSQIVSFFLNIVYLFRFRNIRLTKHCFIPKFKVVTQTAGLGFSSFLNSLSSVIVLASSNNLLSHYGAASQFGSDIPVTTFGLCQKVSMIIISVAMGIASGSQPIIGYNYGAGNQRRVRSAFLLACKLALAVTAIACISFELFPLAFLRVFGTESPLYEEFGVRAFRIYYALSFLNGLQYCACVFFQAIGKPVKAISIALARHIVFVLPAMFILPLFLGIDGVLCSGPVTDILSFILAAVLSVKELKILKQQDPATIQVKYKK